MSYYITSRPVAYGNLLPQVVARSRAPGGTATPRVVIPSRVVMVPSSNGRGSRQVVVSSPPALRVPSYSGPRVLPSAGVLAPQSRQVYSPVSPVSAARRQPFVYKAAPRLPPQPALSPKNRIRDTKIALFDARARAAEAEQKQHENAAASLMERLLRLAAQARYSARYANPRR